MTTIIPQELIETKQAAKAKFSAAGGSVSIDAQDGVTSIVRNSAGDFTVTWSTAFPSADYLFYGACGDRDASALFTNPSIEIISMSTTQVNFRTGYYGSGSHVTVDYVINCIKAEEI